jgi:hypothetical protein
MNEDAQGTAPKHPASQTTCDAPSPSDALAQLQVALLDNESLTKRMEEAQRTSTAHYREARHLSMILGAKDRDGSVAKLVERMDRSEFHMIRVHDLETQLQVAQAENKRHVERLQGDAVRKQVEVEQAEEKKRARTEKAAAKKRAKTEGQVGSG